MVSIPAPVTQMKTEFERARRWRRERREPMQFGDLRWQALDRFLSLGFPTTADPEWQFTDVTAIAEKLFTMALQSASDENYIDLAPLLLPDDFGAELVFVNGNCLPQASRFDALPPGARVESLSQVLDSSASEVISYLGRVARFERRAFVALNTALFGDGACILITPHTVVEKPICLRFISTGEADMRPAISNPRVLLLLGEGSRAAVIEIYTGKKNVQYFTNAVTEIVLAEEAVLDHYKLQCESMKAYHTSATNLIAAFGSNWSRHYISIGGELVRDEAGAVLGGEHANCKLNGLHIVDGERLTDSHTAVEHVGRDCRSRQLHAGIAGDRAKDVFDSTLVVGAEAEKADAQQTSRSLILSEDARTNTTWHFENSARGARCIQRAISRRIGEEAAFHIRSRRVQPADARRLAMLAFARTMLNGIPLQQVARSLEELILQQLEPILEDLS